MNQQSLAARLTDNRYFAALAFLDFRRMWVANFFGQAAAWALVGVRGAYVFGETHSTAMVGITTFAAMGPVFIVPPFAGVLADRFDRRTILAWTYGVNALQNLLLAVLAFAGMLTVWQVVALSLVNGVARAVQMPTSQALAANLVPRERLLNALSLTAATQHASRLVGPGMIAITFALVGAPAAFALSTLLYIVGLVCVRRIATPSVGGLAAGQTFVRNFLDGLRYAFNRPLIRLVILLTFFHCGLTMGYETLLPSFAAQRLTLGGEGFSILLTAMGFGGLIGSFYIGGITSALTRGRLLLITGVLSGLSEVFLGFSSTLTLALVAAALMGASGAALMTMGQAITQSLAVDAYRGRLASLNTFSLGGVMSMMNLVNGFFGSRTSAATLLLVEGSLFAVVMLLSVLSLTPRRVYATGIPAEAHAA
jgi:MFS family permease